MEVVIGIFPHHVDIIFEKFKTKDEQIIMKTFIN